MPWRQRAETLLLLGCDEEALPSAPSRSLTRHTMWLRVCLDLANLQSEMGQHAPAYDSYPPRLR